MISVSEAKEIILKNMSALVAIKLSLADAAGLILAEDVFATINIPAFRQSSMDGYAIRYNGWQLNKKLPIVGVVAAGTKESKKLEPGSAIRIFTGAAVPDGADTVVIQEKAKVENGELIIEDEHLELGFNVRLTGAEIKSGELALSKGSMLIPAAIGLLAGLGNTDVLVYPRPSICIILTGDELQKPGIPLKPGQVYDSNSHTLKAALQQFHIYDVKILMAKDNLETLTETLKAALQQSDLVLVTGGISVGEFDFLLQATINNGVKKLFHKIKQKPGKPLFFGKKGTKYVFGLPGNPASVLTSFYEYVVPTLGLLCNRHYSLKILKVPLSQDFKKPAGLTHFLKGFYDGKTVFILDAQESFRLRSFSKANCLIQIDEDITECKTGSTVEVHLLPDP